MADEKAADKSLEKLPEALKNRRREVELSDGSRVVLEKWSWLKFQELFPKIGRFEEALNIATASVVEKDRPRVEALDPEDIFLLAKVAEEMNVSEALGKNLCARIRLAGALNEQISKGAP